MKHFKLMALALTLMMGLTLTSCLNGDDNPIVQTPAIARFMGGAYGGGYFQMADGTRLVPTDNTHMMTLTAGLYQLFVEYNTDEFPAGSKEITVKLLQAPSRIEDKLAVSKEHSSIQSNKAMAHLEYRSGYQSLAPTLYDKQTILFPFIYWAANVEPNKVSEERKKHLFEVTYEVKDDEKGVLYLNVAHKVTGDKEGEKVTRNVLDQQLFALNISQAITEAKRNGGKVTMIKVVAKCNDINDELTETTPIKNYTIDCSQLDL